MKEAAKQKTYGLNPLTLGDIRKVLKNGNSLGVTIPEKVAQELGLSKGDHVYVSFKKVEVI